ncbi:MAG: NAD(P)/FAD-dependent oxidoreductase [Solirubrobacteraceae bacterium]|nr:NAD(P)/FAD-dependent oxidoreductase [Solirubrobacteraceae bacterium]
MATTAPAPTSIPPTPDVVDHEVVVVGAGIGGIGTAIKLDEIGIHDYLVVDEADDVGGTWHWNRYPGVAVDIPSFSYEFSFAPRKTWSRSYAPGEEVRQYAHEIVERYGLRSRMRLKARIEGARYDDAHLWSLVTDAGDTIVARHVILATGALNTPKKVDIPGVDDFAGDTIHTARWNDDIPLAGRRVGIIGTGASAIQLIAKIAPDVQHLTVFQRTPIWCLPKPDVALSRKVHKAFKRAPVTGRIARALSQSLVELQFPLALNYPRQFPTAAVAEKLGRKMLERQVEDPEIRRKLTPAYSLGCKRPAFHNTYLKTYNRPNVTLETDGIARITKTGIETVEGTSHEFDVLILATGFKVFEKGSMPPFPVAGVGGLDLDGYWAENRYQAYYGLHVPDFPNLHIVFGPYGYNVTSYFTHVENQLRHIGRLLAEARSRGATRIEVTREANDAYFADMQRRRPRQLLVRGNCSPANSYYFDHNGDSPFRNASTIEVRWRSTRYPLGDYRFAAGGAATGGASAGAGGSAVGGTAADADGRGAAADGTTDRADKMAVSGD